MKIEKLILKKQNIYNVVVENTKSFLLFDETILKYNLVVGKKIVNIDEIIKYNDLMKIYYEVLVKVKKKLRTTKEVKDILKEKEINSDEVNIIIDKLSNLKLLNDDVYIKSYISDQINLTLNGPKKITNELLKKGMDINLITNELDMYSDLWDDRINKIVSKKLKSNRKYSNKELKNKINIYLSSLGYDKQYNIEIEITNETELMEKEYNKLYKKHSRKISDEKELEKKIKYELYKKGFKINE